MLMIRCETLLFVLEQKKQKNAQESMAHFVMLQCQSAPQQGVGRHESQISISSLLYQWEGKLLP